MKKLEKKIILTGEITLITGMHIGGSNSQMNIGGPDRFVIRNPLDNRPIIPGSSLKGKLRSLIELIDGNLGKDDGPTQDVTSAAGMLFGVIGEKQRPSRIIIRDSVLKNDLEDFRNTDLPYTESKTEVSINRITSQANPRTFERVPAGSKFALEIILNVFNDGEEQKLIDTTLRAIRLLEDDYLGGNGSRGYGQIKIDIEKTEHRTEQHYKDAAKKAV